MRAVAVAVSAALLGVCAAEELKPSRVHLVDSFTGADGVTNYLFRGNMPINATGFAYDQVLDLMRDRIGGAGLGKLPDDIYLHVVRAQPPLTAAGGRGSSRPRGRRAIPLTASSPHLGLRSALDRPPAGRRSTSTAPSRSTT